MPLATPPSGMCNLSGNAVDASGAALSGAIVNYRLVTPPLDPRAYSGDTLQATSDSNGLFQFFAYLGAEYEIWFKGGDHIVMLTDNTAVQQTLSVPVLGAQTP